MRQRRNAYKEEAKNACARLHSGIMLSVINEFDNHSMKGDDNNEGNGNKEMSIGGSGFTMPSPGYNCEGGTVLIDFRSSLDNVDGDSNNNASKSGIRGLYNNSKILSEEEAEDACVASHKENSRRINISEVDNNNNHVHNNKSDNDNTNNRGSTEAPFFQSRVTKKTQKKRNSKVPRHLQLLLPGKKRK